MADREVEAALDEVLRGSRLTEYFNYRSPSTKSVPVAQVLEEVRGTLGRVDDLPARLDAAVEARGGEKLEMVDLGEKLKNLGRRLIGHAPEPDEELYLIPG